MSTRFNAKNLSLLLASFALMLAYYASAQTITALHTFALKNYNSSTVYTNSDGYSPSDLILLSNRLYGATFHGNIYGNGAVFAMNTNGTGFTNLHTFTPYVLDTQGYAYTNNDGAEPNNLILSSNTLYGTTAYGGTNGSGTIFKINADGTGFTNVYVFTARSGFFALMGTNSDGANPDEGLLLFSNTLYGTALLGGSSSNGTVFKVHTDGTGFTNLHSFAAGVGFFPYVTNNEGANPASELIISNNVLYGTTVYGGTNGRGTVFKINTDGTGFTVLHTFEGGIGVNTAVTNDDGAHPSGRLILSGNSLYGRTQFGGSSSFGTIFVVNTDGTGFTNLHTFVAGSGSYPDITNNDGANPNFIILLNNTLYGTAIHGGSFGSGTIFKLNTDGSGFMNLYNFPARSDSTSSGTNNGGANPLGMIFLGNTIYGGAAGGGTNGAGTVFVLTFAMPLTQPSIGITTMGNQIVLSWPTNATTHALQSVTSLSGSWNNVTSGITIVGTNYVFSNTVNSSAGFFRLKQ